MYGVDLGSEELLRLVKERSLAEKRVLREDEFVQLCEHVRGSMVKAGY
jgi:hypothetical protein